MEHKAWLEKRKSGIGASDAASIIGANPWKTNVRLWEEKTGRIEPEDIGGNPAVAYGSAAEEHLRQLFALDFPQFIVEHNRYKIIANRPEEPWLFATLDGELIEKTNSQNRGVLEVKTAEIMNSAQWKDWSGGRIPQHYYIQVLHQLLATGYGFAYLKAQLKSRDYKNPEVFTLSTKHLRIDAKDVQDDLEFLLVKEIEFYHCIVENCRPPLLLPII